MVQEPAAGSAGVAASEARPSPITFAILVPRRSAAQTARYEANLAASMRPLLTEGLIANGPRRGGEHRNFSLNWRHPLAIPSVLALILFSPVVLAVPTTLKLWNWHRQKTGPKAPPPSCPLDEH